MQFDQACSSSATISCGETTIRILDERLRYSLRLKREDLAKGKKVTKWKLPSKIGETFGDDTMTMACLGPEEWFVVSSPSVQANLTTSLTKLGDKVLTSITDISHRNVAFEIDGPQAARILNVGCPLNLSLTDFPVGKATRSIFENSPVLIIRKAEDVFHVECWRSFAPYMWTFFEAISSDYS